MEPWLGAGLDLLTNQQMSVSTHKVPFDAHAANDDDDLLAPASDGV
jgi:hypothetical protein